MVGEDGIEPPSAARTRLSTVTGLTRIPQRCYSFSELLSRKWSADNPRDFSLSKREPLDCPRCRSEELIRPIKVNNPTASSNCSGPPYHPSYGQDGYWNEHVHSD